MDWSHVGDVLREKRVLRLGRVHVDCLALPGILVRDPPVALGDGGDVVRLEGVVGLSRLRLVVTVGHRGPLSTAKTRIQADISTSMF